MFYPGKSLGFLILSILTLFLLSVFWLSPPIKLDLADYISLYSLRSSFGSKENSLYILILGLTYFESGAISAVTLGK